MVCNRVPTDRVEAVFDVEHELVQVASGGGQILDGVGAALSIANGEADLLGGKLLLSSSKWILCA